MDFYAIGNRVFDTLCSGLLLLISTGTQKNDYPRMLKEIIKPRFLETDALGHINNTIIPSWFEGARDPVFRWFTPDLDVKKWQLILARFDIVFHNELFYEYPVELRTYVSRIGSSSFDVYQEAWQHQRKCVSGTAVIVHYDFKNKSSVKLPEHIRKVMEDHYFDNSDNR